MIYESLNELVTSVREELSHLDDSSLIYFNNIYASNIHFWIEVLYMSLIVDVESYNDTKVLFKITNKKRWYELECTLDYVKIKMLD